MTNRSCALLVALIVGPSLLACSTEADPSDDPDQDSLGMFPGTGFGAHDGTHLFQLPVATTMSDVTWTVDPAQGTVVPAQTPAAYASTPLQTWALVTVNASGTIEIGATSGDKHETSVVQITAYSPAQIEKGKKRYFDPDNANVTNRPSCASCHTKPDGHDQSPMSIMIWSDEQVLRAITTGRYSDEVILTVDHQWNLTSEEAAGIVGYLRSLPPHGF